MANDKRERAWNDSKNEWIASLPDASLVTAKESGCFNDGWFRGYDAATAEGIPQADGWVAIETVDDLPKEDGGYLATFPGDGEYVVGELFLRTDNHQRNWEAGGDGWPDDFKPIAWQPLPAPYQRQSREGE